ncbi:MAG TPA: 3-phosphoshikimate 1-carboxyvinyltransferase [Rhabdochlamydiaceae bacterium]|nr:3-phosphoshikimate 1-carboxyvinyltransferase [Rhabdochlamydiaceae bacterium]
MTTYRINPSSLRGQLIIPPSKSHTIRAILFGMMGKGKTVIHNYLPSPDATAMIEAVRAFGASVTTSKKSLEIQGVDGKIKPAEDVIHAGNSGQIFRFIGALASLNDSYTILTGDYSIRHQRPIRPLLEALQKLGAMAESARQDGYAPIIIKGPIKPGKTSLFGEDSQPVSGILIATSFLDGPSEIEVANPGEKPWIDLTLNWFDRLGIKYENDRYERYRVLGKTSYDGFEMTVPGDFSSAAFPIAAALATDSELLLHNIKMDDVQGDKKLIETLMKMGAKIDLDHSKKTLRVKKGSTLQGMKIDINDFIDSIGILAVIGCFAEGTTEIINAAVARKKESDRIHAITTELKKMGASIEEKEEGLIVRNSLLHGAHLKSHRDHRIAMALSVAALNARGTTVIEDMDCVTKSYPDFLHDFQTIGAAIEQL